MKKRIVIKFGSSSLTNPGKTLCKQAMIELVRQIATLYEKGHELVVVSSGAIAAARTHFELQGLNSTVATKQMLASIGQVELMHTWGELFAIYGIMISQILLTSEDTSNPKRAHHAQDTFNALIAHRIIPIVNENDTVATDEIKVGDNDTLSALVATLISADHLILMTDQEGLFTKDPRKHPDAQLINEIEVIDEVVHGYAGDSTHEGSKGVGGMITKIKAAKIATEKGTTVTIAYSRTPDVLTGIIGGRKIGTTFIPKKI